MRNHACLLRIYDHGLEFLLSDGGHANEMDGAGMLVVARHTRHKNEGELARFTGDLRTQRRRRDSDIALDGFVIAVKGWKGAGVMWGDELGLTAMNDPCFAGYLGRKSVIETLDINRINVGHGNGHSDEV